MYHLNTRYCYPLRSLEYQWLSFVPPVWMTNQNLNIWHQQLCRYLNNRDLRWILCKYNFLSYRLHCMTDYPKQLNSGNPCRRSLRNPSGNLVFCIPYLRQSYQTGDCKCTPKDRILRPSQDHRIHQWKWLYLATDNDKRVNEEKIPINNYTKKNHIYTHLQNKFGLETNWAHFNKLNNHLPLG